MASSNPPGAFQDEPPSYEDEIKKTLAKQRPTSQPVDNTIQLTIDHGLGVDSPPVLTTITITPSTTFEDFQRRIKQRYIELPRSGVGSFVWSTWLWGGSGRSGETEDREYVDFTNWEIMRTKIISLAAAGTLGWKGKPCRLESVFRLVNWAGTKALKAKNAAQLQRMLRLHEGMERSLVLQGRHVPAPTLKEEECVVM